MIQTSFFEADSNFQVQKLSQCVYGHSRERKRNEQHTYVAEASGFP